MLEKEEYLNQRMKKNLEKREKFNSEKKFLTF
jgi:hypothetical protein